MTAKRPTILIVDDERNTREGLQRALQDRYDVLLAEDSQKAVLALESTPVDVMLTDLRMPGGDGIGLLRRALSLTGPPVCIMMTAYGSIENAVQAMQAGAYHYVTKPVNLDELELVIQRALNNRRVEAENVNLRKQIDQKYGLAFGSSSMHSTRSSGSCAGGARIVLGHISKPHHHPKKALPHCAAAQKLDNRLHFEVHYTKTANFDWS